MAHNLNFNEQKNTYSFATAKEKAWHGLGQVTEGLMTTAEALELANLDYNVSKTPNYIKTQEGDFIESGSFSTIRTDSNEILGSKLGKNYTVLQNKEAFEFFDIIVGESESIIETAGCLSNGSTVFITAKMPAHIKVMDDCIDQYLLVSNSHDGTSAVNVQFTPVRVVCNNTLNVALRNSKNKVSISHTSNVKQNLAAAQKILEIQNAYKIELEDCFNAMQQKTMSEQEFDLFLVNLLGDESQRAKYNDGFSHHEALSKSKNKVIEEIKDYYHNGIGQNTPDALNSNYGAFNAITGYLQNVKEYKSPEKKFKNIMKGTGSRLVQNAFNLLNV